MVTYDFYRDSWLGGSIPEEEFGWFAARADEWLCRLRRICRVSVPAGSDCAEEKTLCAVADALYCFEQIQSGAQAAGVSIGSVSSTRAQGAQPDLSPKAQEAELLRCARRYLDIERWCGPC